MFKRTKVSAGVLLAIAGSALTLPVPSFGQTVQRVEVTGSRIKSLNAASSSPITSLSSDELNSQLPVAVEEVLRTLPAAVPAIGPGTNNGTGGGATLDLRGLGSNRSLVLVNGRRLVPFDLQGVVDTNSVPIALIESVDIFTGGASTAYGADAVAGVVNFQLKRNFEGVELSSSYGLSERGDAKRQRTDITLGSNLADGRGNVALSLGVTRTDPVKQGKRPWGAESRSSTTGNPQGSFTTVPAYLDSAEISYQLDENGDPSDSVQTYNFNPLNYYQTPLNRFQATGLANFRVSDNIEVFAEFTYSRSDVISNLAESGTFFNTYSVPIGNPFLSDALRSDICAAYGIGAADCVEGGLTEFQVDIGRRFVEFGPRVNEFRNKTFQATVGTNIALGDVWNLNAYLSRGEADQNALSINWGSNSKVQQALRAVAEDACIDASNGCVPINLFGPAGSITDEMVQFVNLSAISTQFVKQDVGSLLLTGDLGSFKSPFARSPIDVALGFETREMTAGNRSDGASQIQGEVLGTGAPTPDRSGTFKLNEFYAEASIPILSGMPLAHSLRLEAGYRASTFKTSSSTSYGSWKFGGDWEPVRGFKVRAMAQRATRAPNINELFAPQITGLDNLAVDPCQGNRIDPADIGVAGTLTDLCVQTGVPVARVGSLPEPSAGQVNVLSGGEPGLKPEEADTLTVGFIFEPAAVPGLVLSVDYYKIDIDKAISTPSVDDVLGECFDSALNPNLAFNAACAKVGRGPSGTFNGSSSPGIELTNSNQGKQATSGFDFSAAYRLRTSGWGQFDFGLLLNKVDKYWFKASPTSVQRDCLGYYSVACGAPNFEQKFSQRTSWSFGDWRLGYNWRHVSGVVEEPGGTNYLPAYSKIKAYDYIDLSASWNPTEYLTLNVSVTNAFDKKPPEVGNTISGTSVNSGNTFPQTYDAIGRFWTIGAALKF